MSTTYLQAVRGLQRLRYTGARAVKRLADAVGIEIRRASDHTLTRLANRFHSDKGTAGDAHSYAVHYQRSFQHRRFESLTLAELGLKRVDDRRRSSNSAEGSSNLEVDTAPSLELWRTYFPNAKLIGFDIDDFSSVRIDNCAIIQGDSSSSDDLKQILQLADGKIDIIIDDASHASHHQQIALAELYDSLAPGGVYVVEDLHWQDPDFERPNIPTTRDIARRWQCGLTLPSPYLSEQDQKRILDQTVKLELLDSQSQLFADPADALLLLHKQV